MNNSASYFDSPKIARICIICIFLALIRCLAEVFRLEYVLGSKLAIYDIKPFIIGALLSAVSGLVMVLLYFFNRFRTICVIGLTTLILLFAVKVIYL